MRPSGCKPTPLSVRAMAAECQILFVAGSYDVSKVSVPLLSLRTFYRVCANPACVRMSFLGSDDSCIRMNYRSILLLMIYLYIRHKGIGKAAKPRSLVASKYLSMKHSLVHIFLTMNIAMFFALPV